MTWFSQLRQFLSGAKTDPSAKPPYLLSIRSSTTFIVVTVNLAVFTDIFFYGLIAPVLPFALHAQVGIPENQVQHWVSILLAAYSAALLVGSPVSGIYADHTSSRRWPMILGLLALAGSTFLLAFGRTSALFVIGRALQGLTSAVVWSVGCALLVDTLGNNVGVAMGYVNISMSVGLLLSPLIGGSVYHTVGYQAVYYVAFGIVGLDIALRLLMIEKKVAKQWIAEDDSPSESSDGAKNRVEKAAAPVAGSDAVPTDDMAPASPAQTNDDTPQVSAGDQHQRKRHPVLVLLKSTRLLAALYGVVVESGILLGFDAVLAIFCENTFGWNSLDVSILFLALFIPGFIAPLAGWLADRYGTKWPSFAGFVVTVPLLISLRFVTQNTLQHKALLAVLLALLGVSLPFSMTPLMAEVSYMIEAEEAKSPGIFGDKGAYGLGYGLFNVAFALGGIVGPVWAGYIVDDAGWGTLTWSFAIWAASAAAVVLVWLDSGVRKKVEPTTDREA
ncbi:MFS transporter-like protein [Xylariaceae sp. FL1019]|nr:MFS transporter-like protein [Xylariaceae sp. FL1019]